MGIRIGWTLERPRRRKPGQIGGGVWLFELLKVDDKDGRRQLTVVGLLTLRREDLLNLKEKGVVLDLTVIGAVRLADDVTPELIAQTIGRRRIIGAGSAFTPSAS